MQDFTNNRGEETFDELWVLEHEPVFTQGRAGKPEHILKHSNIPLVQSDRGGQVTYHGPGQLIFYPLLDIKRRNLGVRSLVTLLEQWVIRWLADYSIEAYAKAEAPGVYVDEAKIASLGLRVRRGYCFHGVSINIDMDLSPFSYINPCGYQGLKVTQLADLIMKKPSMEDVQRNLSNYLCESLEENLKRGSNVINEKHDE